MMLTVAGSLGVLLYGLHTPLAAAITAAAGAGLLSVYASIRFQRARWRGATATGASFTLG